eukprot:CAMPEP_0194036210 /NCGR_PEP_ID=MMETSP0009_2-20130614/8570_1 /TAXON_ID=210454 /ORGANISM="Grammatophora oceanica, Strain CCMP 410" /LENGTH=36 /DNA_ID= /DNA_START= /DNA_END= /DNA_ORIENTATION=
MNSDLTPDSQVSCIMMGSLICTGSFDGLLDFLVILP